MAKLVCPGSSFLVQPKPEEICCPNCGNNLEIWSDEMRSICDQCGRTAMRKTAVSCVEWCKMAKECVGQEVYDKYMANRALTSKPQ